MIDAVGQRGAQRAQDAFRSGADVRRDAGDARRARTGVGGLVKAGDRESKALLRRIRRQRSGLISKA